MKLDLNLTKNIHDKESVKGLSFVYPFGCSIKMSECHLQHSKTVPLLTSGQLNFPVKDALLAVYQNSKTGGKIVACGSYKLLTNEYLQKEENQKLVDIIFDFNNEISKKIEPLKPADLEKYNADKTVPCIEKLSENLKSAIETSPDLSTSVFTLFENNLFKVHFGLQKEAIQLHKRLNIERKPLTLIKPVFETPMLGLTPAVFPPILIDIHPPGLELYDLDDEFANPRYFQYTYLYILIDSYFTIF